MINAAPPTSNSLYGREKWFSYNDTYFSNVVCLCGAVVKAGVAYTCRYTGFDSRDAVSV